MYFYFVDGVRAELKLRRISYALGMTLQFELSSVTVFNYFHTDCNLKKPFSVSAFPQHRVIYIVEKLQMSALAVTKWAAFLSLISNTNCKSNQRDQYFQARYLARSMNEVSTG
jgi:hypothetical protein